MHTKLKIRLLQTFSGTAYWVRFVENKYAPMTTLEDAKKYPKQYFGKTLTIISVVA